MTKDTLAVEKKSLALARTERLMRQEDLQQESGVGAATISRVENGNSIRLLNAQKILRVLNQKGAELGLEPLQINDLDWNVEGL